MSDTTDSPQEELWQFPCDFPIKIVGKNNPDFESFALATILKHFPDVAENALQTRPSKDGTYLAITVIVKAQSKEQLDAAYLELTASSHVMMAL